MPRDIGGPGECLLNPDFIDSLIGLSSNIVFAFVDPVNNNTLSQVFIIPASYR